MRGRVRSVKEMRPHDEKLTEKIAETRLGIWRGKGTAWATRTHDGELGKRMHGGGVGGRVRAAERGGGEWSGVVGVVGWRGARGGASGGPTHSL